jgi:hypothetical protein
MHALTNGLDPRTTCVPYLLSPPLPDTGGQQVESSYATGILKLSQADICEGALSLELLKGWSDDIKSGVQNTTFPIRAPKDIHSWFNINDVWVFDRAFRNLSTEAKLLNAITRALSNPLFWKNPDPRIHKMMLSRLYQLDRGIFIPEDHPAKQVLHKFMDSVAEWLLDTKSKLLDTNAQREPHFSIPLLKHQDKFLFCFKTSTGWRFGDFKRRAEESLKVVQMNLEKTQTLLIDQQENLIPDPAMIISAYTRQEISYTDSNPVEKIQYQGVAIKVDFLFYNGSLNLAGSKTNSTAITASINLHNKSMDLLEIQQDSITIIAEKDKISEQELLSCREHILVVFPSFGHRLIEDCYKFELETITIPLFEPRSETDKLIIIFKLLENLSTKPVSNNPIAEISYIAEKLNLTVSQGKVDLLLQSKDAANIEGGYLRVAPKAVLAELQNQVKEKLQEAWKTTLAKAALSSSGEQVISNSVYGADPMKSKAFTTLAIDLLQKEAADRLPPSSGGKGDSYVKFYRPKGASSETAFVIRHQEKDLRGHSRVRSEILDGIFAL